MSQSPSESMSMASDSGNPQSAKRQRTSFSSDTQMMLKLDHPSAGSAPPPTPTNGNNPGQHVPKRGARACTACRKGKNRCEGEVSRFLLATYLEYSLTNIQSPCRRCQLSGTPCVFEKPERKTNAVVANSVECVLALFSFTPQLC